jgi:hypothetical protein
MRREPQDAGEESVLHGSIRESGALSLTTTASDEVRLSGLQDIKRGTVATTVGLAVPQRQRRWVLAVVALGVLACAAVGVAVALGTNQGRRRGGDADQATAGQVRAPSSPSSAPATFVPTAMRPPGERPTPRPTPPPTPAGRSQSVRVHRLPAEPEALCNDGTSPVIRYSPGTEGYVVMLDGGGQCSELRCLQNRAQPLRSTAEDVDGATSFDLSGVLSRNPKVSPVAHYSLVTVRYCSSDGWHGDRSGAYSDAELDAAGVNANDRFRYEHFRGARIVDAVFRLLMDPARAGERAGIGMPRLAPDAPVLFGGFSAGARGAMVNGDGVRARFNLTRLALWLDSGYYVDMGVGSTLREQTAQLFARYVDGSEAAAPQWNNVSRWQDLFGVYRMPAITSRFVAVASQKDSFQVNVNTVPGVGSAVGHAAVQAMISAGLEALEPQAPCSSIVSDTDESHAETAGDFKFNTIGAPQVSLGTELRRVLDPSCKSLVRYIRPI